jgi:hypothetical protein
MAPSSSTIKRILENAFVRREALHIHHTELDFSSVAPGRAAEISDFHHGLPYRPAMRPQGTRSPHRRRGEFGASGRLDFPPGGGP